MVIHDLDDLEVAHFFFGFHKFHIKIKEPLENSFSSCVFWLTCNAVTIVFLFAHRLHRPPTATAAKVIIDGEEGQRERRSDAVAAAFKFNPCWLILGL